MLTKEMPRSAKVIWYNTKDSIPEIAPTKAFGPAAKPQGQKDDRTLVANSPDAVSRKQFIWRPENPEPLPADAPAPNLVALSAPKPEPKAFVPPAPRPQTEPAPVLESPPAIELKAAPKLFVPPPSIRPPAGDVKISEAPPEAPQDGVPSDAGAGSVLKAVIVGLSPAPGNIPEGSRHARFALAPTAGPPSSGAAPSNGAPTVPGLLVHNKPGPASAATPAPRAPAPPERLLLKETRFANFNRTVSVPLRPSSRVIPASVETQFANRNVYTLVIPAPEIPEYAGDWVLWFSERGPGESQAGRISAPVPARKYSLLGSSAPVASLSANGTVQLAAVIDRNGRISAPRVLRKLATEDFRLKAIEELQSWEFQPALRNGEPVEVDIVVEIPFQFREAVQQAR